MRRDPVKGRECRHNDTDVEKIAQRMEERAYSQSRRDELYLGRDVGHVRLKYSRRGSTERERAFARHWFFASGYLRYMLKPYPRDHDDRPHFVTKREAEVAATLMRWLGTNVGFCWLEEVLASAGYKVVKV